MAINRLSLLGALLLIGSLAGCGGGSSRLIADLNAEDPAIRDAAIRELIVQPTNSDEVITELIALCGSQEVQTRKLAVTALGSASSESVLARDGLAKALDDPNPAIQFEAAKNLINFDSTDEPAQKIILAEIRDVNPHAILLVIGLKANGHWAAPALRQLVYDENESVRLLAKRALESVSDGT